MSYPNPQFQNYNQNQPGMNNNSRGSMNGPNNLNNNSNPNYFQNYQNPNYYQSNQNPRVNPNLPLVRPNNISNNYVNPNENKNIDDFQINDRGDQDSLLSTSRNKFIRKVYTLLSIQLLITVGVCYWAMNSQFFKKAFVNVPVIIILSVLLIALSCVIACCTEFMRKYGLPIFILFTIVMSIFVGIACAGTKPYIVLTAAGLTALIVIVLTAYACFTDTDFTGCGVYFMVCSIVLFFFGIVVIFWHNPIAHLIYSCLGALMFSVYLIFDTQLVMGRFQNKYTLDDAYIAAIQLYIDIIQIFLQLLQILSIAEN